MKNDFADGRFVVRRQLNYNCLVNSVSGQVINVSQSI